MIVAFKEKGWLDPKTDFRMWDHLCRSMEQDLQLITDFSEANIPSDGKIIIMDESASDTLQSFVHPDNAVYVFGRSGLNKMQDRHYSDYAIRIDTVTDVCLFGIEAASMVLYDRMVKEALN